MSCDATEKLSTKDAVETSNPVDNVVFINIIASVSSNKHLCAVGVK